MLEVISGPMSGTRLPLSDKRETVVGRDGTCDIVIAKTTVSRRHARIVAQNECYYVEDLGSVHGTFVNSKSADGLTKLKGGDRINIYDVCLLFSDAESADHQNGDEPQSAAQRHVLAVQNDGALGVRNGSETIIFGADANPELTFVKPAMQLRSIVTINQRLCASLNADEVLPQVLDLLFDTFTHATNGRILLLDDDGKLMPRALKQGREDDSAVFSIGPLNDAAATRVIETGEIAVAQPGESDSILDDDDSTVTAPIVGPSQVVLGVIHLEMDPTSPPLGETDVEFISAVGYATGQAVELTRAHRRLLEVNSWKQEMDMARQVQVRMLPQTHPEIEGYSVDDSYTPAENVGGDFYYYFPMPNGSVVMVVGDVCGKGVSAALTVAELITEVRHAIENAKSIKRVMHQLNQVACRRAMRLVTFVLGLLDPEQHTLTVANAGNMPPLCRRHASGIVERLQPQRGGIPLGLIEEQEYHPERFELEPGDTVTLLTDGIYETMDDQGRLYGMDRTTDVLTQETTSAAQTLRTLVADVERFRNGRDQTDDMCLVCIQRNGGS